jgi:hypothetical protein
VLAFLPGHVFVERCLAQEGSAIPPKKLATFLATLTPKGWEIYDEIAQFTAENLYEQINGRAEYYLAYDVVGATFASFDKSGENSDSINLTIYDMGTPTHAFGVFSGERSFDAARLKFGRDAYALDANYYVWKGQYYIKIISTGTTDELRQNGMNLAKNLDAFLPDSGEPVWGLGALPKKNRVPQSIQYFLVDALGLDFMLNTYTAKYYKNGQVISVFLSARDSLERAETTVRKFTRHANSYGAGCHGKTAKGVELVACDMRGSYDVVFQRGFLVAGVTDVLDENLAVEAAIELWRQLRVE